MYNNWLCAYLCYFDCLFLDDPTPTVILNLLITEDIMIVNWTATNKGNIESLELSISNDTYEEKFPICCKEIVKVSLEPGEYTLTLITFDICGRNYSSEPYSANIFEPEPTSVQASTWIQSTPSIKMTQNSLVTQGLKVAQSLTSSICPVVTPTICMKESSTCKDT